MKTVPNIPLSEFTTDTVLITPAGLHLKLGDWLKQYAVPERRLYLGTDSRQGSHSVTYFTTVLVAHRPGKGGVFAFVRDKCRRIHSLPERLMTEALQSVRMGLLITQMAPKCGIITVHLDVNKDVKFKSGTEAAKLVGFVTGQGFKAEIKPDSWAATTIADRLVRAS